MDGRRFARGRACRMRWVSALVLAGAAPALSGCGSSVSDAFGFERHSPNEFTVTTQAPLVMPPAETLPPPRPGEARPQDQNPRLAALEAIAPDVAINGTGGTWSPGQRALLAEALRRAEAPIGRGEIRGGGGGLMGDLAVWQSRPSDVAVAAVAEQRRLRQDEGDGLPPTAGATPATEAP